jgi:hypothetical protein
MEMRSYDSLSCLQFGTVIATMEIRLNRGYKGVMTKIDTAEAVEDLKGAGASQKLASAIGSLATKDDLRFVTATLCTEIVNAKTDIQRRINASQNWVVGTQIAIAGLMIAALKFS